MDKRLGRVKWGPSGARSKTGEKYWNQPLKWNEEARLKGVRKKVFCSSLADVFEDKPDQLELNVWRGELYNLILNTPHLDWLLLTKRPENVMLMVPPSWLAAFPANVWMGISAENQETYMERCQHLMGIPAQIRFLSLEPLQGPINLGLAGTAPAQATGSNYWQPVHTLIDWVIVGGESGPKARLMKADWVVDLRTECLDHDVPFLFKQWGKWLPKGQISEGRITEGSYDKENDAYAVGKKIAGRRLYGVEWLEFPESVYA
jgi:protein gp37